MIQRLILVMALVSLVVPAASGAEPLALSFGHVDDLDGRPEAPAVDGRRWLQAVFEVGRSSAAPDAWPDPGSLRERARSVQRGTMPLGLLHGTAMVEGQKTEVFAFGALRKAAYRGLDLQLVLSGEFLLDAGPGRITAMRLDADDGGAWRPLRPGRPVPVAYAATGRKTLRLEADLDDGRTLHAAAALLVKRLVTPDPTETWQITATESYDGVYGTGQAYVYLSDAHTTLTNPVVVSEGFDMDNTMDWPVLYDLLNQENLIEDLRAMGFDAVVMDYTEATDPIQRNAFVLTALLERVRQAAGPDRTMTLIGASMGGLVTRYALLWSEQQGIDHRVRTWVSFDSPQKGAIIPLGLQHWLDFFRNQSADADYLLSRLETPAARQMLIYHHLNSATAPPGPAPDFPAFYGELDAMGGWPATPWKVSVVNGSGQGVNQGFNPGDQLIDYTYRSFLVDIDGNIWATPDGNELRIFQGRIDRIWPLHDERRNVYVQFTAPWDGAPGGYRASLAEMDTTAVDYGDIVALHDNHCFIPVVSALALDTGDPFFDVAGTPDLLALTPFDEVHYPAENQEHVSITAESKPWFIGAVTLGVSGVEDRAPVPGPAVLLDAPWPNPFNPRVNLKAEFPVPGTVTLEIFDVRGRLVATLADGQKVAAGSRSWTWDGRGDDGRSVAAGVYQARLRGLGGIRTQTLTLVK